MKKIDVDDDLYRYIASHTQHIGESASDILRRMLKMTEVEQAGSSVTPATAESAAVLNAGVSISSNRVRTLREMLLSDNYAKQKSSVSRFMLVLSTLYQVSAKEFADATLSLQGRTRVYFASDEKTLLQSGNHTKPRHIPGTPYWVITNTNTERKCSMIEHIMLAMAFPKELSDKICSTI